MVCINAFTIYKIISKAHYQRDFIFKLGEELREDYLEKHNVKRCENELTKFSTAGATRATKRKQCQIVANCAQNKTK